jgi:hypothetical protein
MSIQTETVKGLLNKICRSCKIPVADAFLSVGSAVVSDSNHLQLVELANEEIKYLISFFDYAEIQKEFTITLVDGQEAYAFPNDFQRFIQSTDWNRTGELRLGLLNPQEWQSRKSGNWVPARNTEYRIKGSNSNQIFISPVPTSSTAGQILVFEYISRSIVRPRRWLTATTYLAGAYVMNGDNMYKTTAGGTSGATAPTGTGSSINDGGVVWSFSSECYCDFYDDNDTLIIEPHIFRLGVKYRWLAENGYEATRQKAEYDAYLRRNVPNKLGSKPVSMTPGAFSDSVNYPDDIIVTP